MTLSINDYVINDCFRLVESVERNALAELLKPYHDANCSCSWCQDVKFQEVVCR
jgi:hypothetical protein